MVENQKDVPRYGYIDKPPPSTSIISYESAGTLPNTPSVASYTSSSNKSRVCSFPQLDAFFHHLIGDL